MKFALPNTRLIIAVIVTMFAGLTVMWVIAKDLDQKARNNMMIQARIIASSIDHKELEKLSASKSDTELSEYSNIKEQLYNVRTLHNTCRFLYIVGHDKNNNNVFFYVDSQLPDSEDYAPPGLIYDEVTDEFRDIVISETESFVGPVTDRWGTLVTALVPIIDTDTNRVIATLGMDMDANEWYSRLAELSMLPVSLTLFVTLLIVISFFLKLKTRELNKSISVDTLTGLYSRKTILDLAEKELNKSIRNTTYYSIIMLDIDFFKQVNDKHGHQIGDDVLRKLASCLQNTVRKTDFVGRIGGEEFIILLPHTNEAEATEAAEKIRGSIEALTFDNPKYNGLSTVTISLGVSSTTKKTVRFDDLYAQADKALYISKNAGRNRVSVCTD